MDEAQKMAIMKALMDQGLLGGGIADLRPVWGKMNIDAQMQGQSYPQYRDWYRMVQEMKGQGYGSPDSAQQQMGGTPMNSIGIQRVLGLLGG